MHVRDEHGVDGGGPWDRRAHDALRQEADARREHRIGEDRACRPSARARRVPDPRDGEPRAGSYGLRELLDRGAARGREGVHRAARGDEAHGRARSHGSTGRRARAASEVPHAEGHHARPRPSLRRRSSPRIHRTTRRPSQPGLEPMRACRRAVATAERGREVSPRSTRGKLARAPGRTSSIDVPETHSRSGAARRSRVTRSGSTTKKRHGETLRYAPKDQRTGVTCQRSPKDSSSSLADPVARPARDLTDRHSGWEGAGARARPAW